MKTLPPLTFIFLALFQYSAYATCNSNAAINLVNEFYKVGNHPWNVPETREIEKFRFQLSKRLFESFIKANKYQRDWISEHPNIPSQNDDPPIIYKPPFVEGDIFTGTPDGSALFKITNVVNKDYRVWNVFIESIEQPRMSSWSVKVNILSEQNHCVIDNVIYKSLEGSEPKDLLGYLRQRHH